MIHELNWSHLVTLIGGGVASLGGLNIWKRLVNLWFRSRETKIKEDSTKIADAAANAALVREQLKKATEEKEELRGIIEKLDQKVNECHQNYLDLIRKYEELKADNNNLRNLFEAYKARS